MLLPLEEKIKNRINKSTVIGGYEAVLETKIDSESRGGRLLYQPQSPS